MLCYLAHQFPPFIANFLERSRQLRRRFREETVTDLLMGSLVTAGGRQIIVEFPDEPVTGADMEWNFANPSDGTFFRILLQAKQCYGAGKVWTRHCYRELLHMAGSGPKLQATALCDTARGEKATYPLYIFYHPESTCIAAGADGLSVVTGVSLADGYTIEQLVTAAKTRTLRTRNKSLKTIAPLLFPLSDLFCPSTVLDIGPQAFALTRFVTPMAIGHEGGRPVFGVPIPPTPAVIRDRIARSLEFIADGKGTVAAGKPSVPAVAQEIPSEVLSAIEGKSSKRDIQRWRVTFVSESQPDMDTELAHFRQGSR